MADNVNHPEHYTKHNVTVTFEPYQLCELTNDWHLGDALKYIFRYMDKNNPIEDLQKALWHFKKFTAKNVEQGGDYRFYDTRYNPEQVIIIDVFRRNNKFVFELFEQTEKSKYKIDYESIRCCIGLINQELERLKQ